MTAYILALVAATLLIIKKNNKKMAQTSGNSYPNASGSNRGLRNNNPLNIRKNSDVFQGEIVPSGDNAFKQFSSMLYGYRAAFKIINNYIAKGYNTITKIVSRWAPASENNTSSYISNVEKRSGIGRNTAITSKTQIIKIVQAMSVSEVGYMPSLSELEKAYSIL